MGTEPLSIPDAKIGKPQGGPRAAPKKKKKKTCGKGLSIQDLESMEKAVAGLSSLPPRIGEGMLDRRKRAVNTEGVHPVVPLEEAPEVEPTPPAEASLEAQPPLPAPEVRKKKGKKPKAKNEAKLPGEEGLFDGALLPALGTTHQGVKCPVVGSLLAFFKGKIENVKVDLMVIEGDQDPQIRGTEGKRLAKIAGPALQEASLARGGRSAGNLRVTPGYHSKFVE